MLFLILEVHNQVDVFLTLSRPRYLLIVGVLIIQVFLAARALRQASEFGQASISKTFWLLFLLSNLFGLTLAVFLGFVQWETALGV